MFNITEFIMKTLKGMIGHYPDFQVSEYALNWYAKGKLTEENLAEIEVAIEAQYIEPETTEEIPADEITGEVVEETEESTEEESGETVEEATEETTNEEATEEVTEETTEEIDEESETTE